MILHAFAVNCNCASHQSKGILWRQSHQRSVMSLCGVHMSQIDDWDFDIFDLSIKTSGRPLYTVCMALMEKEGLLVPALPVLPSSSHKFVLPVTWSMTRLIACSKQSVLRVSC